MIEFSQLKKNLKKDFSKFKQLKVALLGDSATQFLAQAIRGFGYEHDLDLVIWEADFNQINLQLLDPTSDYYKYQPDFTIIFQSSHKLLSQFYTCNKTDQKVFAKEKTAQIESYITHIHQKLKTKIIFYNFAEIDNTIYGNFANLNQDSFLFQLRLLNIKLMQLGAEKQSIHICDLSSIQNRIGRNTMFEPSIYISTEMVLSIPALPELASRTTDIIAATQGKIKKCLVLDLDNTLWGGTIGDDGLANIEIGSLGIGKAFTEFQRWIKALKNRGIILAVCSKNDEKTAKEPFEKHPEMVLKLDDISVFVANWGNKVKNIQYIQRILNIGFDSMVFLDDNPFERNMVKEHLPEICVPEIPEDPANYLEYLYSLNLFETVSASKEDSERTKRYQTEAKRATLKQSFVNENDFLQSLNMRSTVDGFTTFNIPRVAQLTQRSNQFNLRTVRYSESEIEEIALDINYVPITFTLKDRFGDNGLICVVILKKQSSTKLFIDTWLMSCRVLKRGMEHFVLNTLVEQAKKLGYPSLVGEYIPTAKNTMVQNHYRNLGFEKRNDIWILNIEKYQAIQTYIQLKESNKKIRNNEYNSRIK